jgi:hypothetical protein
MPASRANAQVHAMLLDIVIAKLMGCGFTPVATVSFLGVSFGKVCCEAISARNHCLTGVTAAMPTLVTKSDQIGLESWCHIATAVSNLMILNARCIDGMEHLSDVSSAAR